MGFGTITLTNVAITGNRTGDGGVGVNSGYSGGNSGYGGGIYTLGAALTLTNVNISNNVIGNTTRGDSGLGGGIMVYSGTVKLINSTVSNNLTGSAIVFPGRGGLGGGIANFGTLIVMGSTINGNTTGNSEPTQGTSGGGVFNGFTMTLINSTISGNSTGTGGYYFNVGGGGISTSSPLTLINCTVTANTVANGNGGGIYGSDRTTVSNTIIAGNAAVDSADVKGALVSQGHNLVGKSDGTNGFISGVNGDQAGTSASPLDPKLGPLASNGGPTQTHALLAGSPALDAGDNTLAKDSDNNALTTDQRGTGRYANSAGSLTVDIGAFELHPLLEDVPDKTINEDTELQVSFSTGDGAATVASVTASSSNPTLVPYANLSLTGAGSARTLRVTPAANQSGAALITLTVTESGGAAFSTTFTLTVTEVNDAPTFTSAGDQTVNEDSGAQVIPNWATAISAGPNELGQTVTFQLTGNTNPALFSSGPSISNTGTLTYTPAPNAYGSAMISVTLKDDGGTANGGQDTSATLSFMINVNAVNEAPTFTKGADQTVNEDSGFRSVQNWATNISAGPNESAQSLDFVVTGNTNTALFSFAPSINSFGTLTFSPAANANGSAVITVVLKDSGGTANGGENTSTAQTFTINVTAVNDAPFNQIPSSPATNQNSPLVFSTATFNAISLSDIDAGTDPLRVTLSTPNGTLSLGTTTGLTFVTGDGTDDAAMTFTGPLGNLNAALNGLTFKPTIGFNGPASIQFSTDDQGYNGSGGAKIDTDFISILVRAGGVLQFSIVAYGVIEDTGVAIITVTRTGGNGGATSVGYTSSNGTANGGAACTTGIDYVNTSGTLSWANNETSPKTFAISVCPDSSNELDETINLALSNPVGSASLGTRTAAALTIVNDDPPVLLTEENSDRAIVLDSITMTRAPFSLLNSYNLNTDHHQRLSFFVWRLGLLPTDTAANVSVLAEDNQGTPYNLAVEYVGPVAGLNDVTQVVVRLPENVIGAPRDLWVKVTLRGPSSNRGVVTITGP
jgi:hypothetical protein